MWEEKEQTLVTRRWPLMPSYCCFRAIQQNLSTPTLHWFSIFFFVTDCVCFDNQIQPAFHCNGTTSNSLQ